MSTQDKLLLIFERWKAALRDKPRGMEFVVSNFDELFESFLKAGATFEEAYDLLPLAIKAHQPSPGLIRSFWKIKKTQVRNFDLSEKEFAEKWCGDIADMGTNSFYNAFPLPDGDGAQQPGTYAAGKISEKEYKLMRNHAEQFKPFDFSSLLDPNDDLMTDEEEIMKLIKGRINE